MLYVVAAMLLYVMTQLHFTGRAARIAAMRAHFAEMKADYLREHLGPTVDHALKKIDHLGERLTVIEEVGALVGLNGAEANRFLLQHMHDEVVRRHHARSETPAVYEHVEALLVETGKTDVDDLLPKAKEWYGINLSILDSSLVYLAVFAGGSLLGAGMGVIGVLAIQQAGWPTFPTGGWVYAAVVGITAFGLLTGVGLAAEYSDWRDKKAGRHAPRF
jgi:hypothetical protein